MNPLTWLAGYRTYFAAVLLALLGLAQAIGVDVPGVQLDENWLVLLLNALGLGGLRAAMPPK